MPRVGRNTAAILGAALAPVLLVFVLELGASEIDERSACYLVTVFWFALGHAVLFGLPTMIFLQETGNANVVAAITAGFTIGAVPLGVATGFMSLGSGADWGEFAAFVGRLGLYGAGGGLTAWAIWRASTRVPVALVLAVAAIAGAVAVLAAPGRDVDRTCHNLATYGLRSISPEVNAELHVDPTEWLELSALFERFSVSLDWSFRDSTRTEPIQSLYLSVCSPEGTRVMAMRQIWPNAPDFMQEMGISIAVYQPLGGDGWQAPARQLLEAIEEQWPGKLIFTGEVGEPIAPPDFLREAASGASP